MRTSIAPRFPGSRLNFVLLGIFVLSSCSIGSELKSHESLLIENIRERLETKNYIKNNTQGNPYSQFGKNVQKFRTFLRTEIQNSKQVDFKKKMRVKSQNAGIFNLVANDNTLGMTDPEAILFAQEKLKKYHDENGQYFDSKSFIKVNDKLNEYSNTESGVNDLLEDARKEGSLSDIQTEILKTTLLKISKASDLDEAISINLTVENEVINSKIADKEKEFLLQVNSIFSSNFESQKENLSADHSKTTIFRTTAVVATAVVAFVLPIVYGALIGLGAGIIVCCFLSPVGSGSAAVNCTGSCIGDWVETGAWTGLAISVVGSIP